ncbi:MAG: M42 family metallopeptidase [Candidatus Cryosericum sp.]
MEQKRTELLRRLSEARGISGHEDEVAAILTAELEGHADRFERDAIKNLFVLKGMDKPGPKVMLNAHMDEVGLYVTRITKEGYLHVGKAGGIDDRLLLGEKVLIGKDRLPGVIAIKAVHLSTREECATKVIKVEDMVIDVGAKSDKELTGKVAVGDQVTFDTTFGSFGDGYLVGKAFDDRAGCAVVAELLKMDWPFPVIGMFSTQEEVGTKGARVGAWRYTPDISITVEGTIAADIGEVKDYQEVTNLGGGTVLTIKDGGMITDHRLRNRMIEIAKANGLPWQFKRLPAGGTDARSIQLTKSGVRAIAVAVPSRYIHSPVSLIKASDYENTVLLLSKFLADLASPEA